MNPIDKIDRAHRQGLVLHGFCLTSFFIVFYLLYEISIFAQVFAHYTYSPVQLEQSETPLQCHYGYTGCLAHPRWYSHRKASYLFCELNMPKHTYKVGSNAYTLRLSNYTFEPPCILDKTIYVSPINSGWAVADNRLPDGLSAINFYENSLHTLLYIGIFLSLACIILSSRPKKVFSVIKEDITKRSILNSVILPFYSMATTLIFVEIYEYGFMAEETEFFEFLLFRLPPLIGLLVYLFCVPFRQIFLSLAIIYLWALLNEEIFIIFFNYSFLDLDQYYPGSESPIFYMPLALILHAILILTLTVYKSFKTKNPTP